MRRRNTAFGLLRPTNNKNHREERVNKHLLAGAVAALALAAGVTGASAEDTLKLAVGQRGNWDTSISEVGQLAGIFKKHGLALEIVYTSAAGVMGVFGAFSKGAPVRVIGAETTGANDLYWYVKTDSPIKSLKDTDGK